MKESSTFAVVEEVKSDFWPEASVILLLVKMDLRVAELDGRKIESKSYQTSRRSASASSRWCCPKETPAKSRCRSKVLLSFYYLFLQHINCR